MGLWLAAAAWATSALAAMPVRSVDYTVKVDGPLAEMRIEQVFVNDGDTFIEAIYVFPLNERAAVDGMRMVVGERVIEGEVRERQQAEEAYQRALDKGRVAAITTEHRPNLFNQRVGNIGPGEEVRVELNIIQPVPHIDGAYELVLPLAAAPRFVSPEQWQQEEFPQDRPFSGPPLSLEQTQMRAGIDVEIDSGLPFEFMLSPSHEMAVSELPNGARAVTGRVLLDRDFVLKWNVSARHPLVSLHVQDGHALIAFEPPDAPQSTQIVPREFIWVIDQSCSMSGQPIELVRKAMLSALDFIDERDSIRILRFNETVEGDAVSRPATDAVIEEARAEILALDTDGGTYLLDGVLAALETPQDPSRERTILFLTDALISNDRAVLRAIADRVGAARLFAFGVGPASNRWLLEEMADFGGGRTSWLRDGEAPEEAVERFVEMLAKPVMTDISVNWGDWEVAETQPERIPALYAGQPLLLTSRIIRQGSSNVVIRGRLGDGLYEIVLSPNDAGNGRAIPSTWARQKIANLERQGIWGIVPEIEDEILETSLSYQVLSKKTAFLAIDRDRIVNPGEPIRDEVQPGEVPHGTQWSVVSSYDHVEYCMVMAPAVAVDTEAVSRVQVLRALEQFPMGRNYRPVIQTVAGVYREGGSPNPGAGASNEITYLLDGVNLTDPVTGTPSMNLPIEALQQIEVLTGGRMPEIAGSTGPIANLVTRSGTNNLETALRVGHLTGMSPALPLQGNHVSGRLTGPLVRDKMWLAGSYGFDQTVLSGESGRGFSGHTGVLKWTHQPNPDHRFSVLGAGERSTIEITDPTSPEETDQASLFGHAQWTWFLSPDVNAETSISAQTQQIDTDLRRRLGARTEINALSIDDPLGGTHDLGIGFEVDRIGWRLSGDWAQQMLGFTPPDAGGALAGSAFAQDSFKPVSNLTLHGGARLDVALGRLHTGPELHAAWDPFGDQRTKLAVGFGRLYSRLSLPVVVIEPDQGLSRLDEWLAAVEREVVDDLALGVELAHRSGSGIPAYGGDRSRQTAMESRLFLHKVSTRRWEMLLSWRYARLLWGTLGDPAETIALSGFAHSADGFLSWELPTDPFTLSIGFTGALYADPLGTPLPDRFVGSSPDTPRFSGGLRLTQAIDVRKGRFLLDAELLYVSLLDDERDLSQWRWMQGPVLMQPGWEGPRAEVGLTYTF